MRLIFSLSATLAVSLLLAFLEPGLMLQPGELTEGHRSLDRDCFRCHAPMRGATAGGCLSCHRLDQIGRATTAGVPLPVRGARKTPFHASLADPDCMQCHALHEGDRHRQAPGFRHELLAAAIRRDCQSCHLDRKPADTLHRGAADACASCHSTAAWKPASFDHGRYFRFDANHPPNCQTCHTDAATYASYTCYGCHEHSPGRILAEHQEEGIRNIENCARCHRSGQEGEAEGRGGEGEHGRGYEGEGGEGDDDD